MRILFKMVGTIEVITGCMFSGKSTELLRRLHDLDSKFILLKPKLDTRYSLDEVITHSGEKKSAFVVNNVSEIFNNLNDIKIIGIDEAQFFSYSIVEDCLKLKKLGCTVIVAGLNKDYLNEEFKSVYGLIDIADSTTKLYAICNKCKKPASRSHRLSNETSKILLGHKDCYEPLCKKCYENVK